VTATNQSGKLKMTRFETLVEESEEKLLDSHASSSAIPLQDMKKLHVIIISLIIFSFTFWAKIRFRLSICLFLLCLEKVGPDYFCNLL